MSLSSNIETRSCPRCGREILATASHCQFCHSEVAPTQVVQSKPYEPVVFNKSARAAAWQEIANTVIGILWAVGGAMAAIMSLFSGGLLAIPGMFIGGCVIYLGIGIVRQQWLAMVFARLLCVAQMISAAYWLIASIATVGTAAHFSLARPIVTLAITGFEAYIFWSISD